ncbi:histidine phosphatase superfamily [Armillaria borealis]|uniref:Histidine phosphatase superfamily n=1 Tax=Armillaria borealis TaxID=47425 RepID=A0AA39JPU2_9AGAR|nr:histidine phosphatase superfamily [Armillaria borealis]
MVLFRTLQFLLNVTGFVAVVSAEKYNWLGNLSPYHKAPVPRGVSETLPEDCTVVQVMLMGRHGSRWPLQSELVYITNLTEKLAASTEYIQNADLPENLQFLKSGYVTTLGHDNLTAPGRKEMFDHGVNFRLKYQHLEATSVLAGDQDRVVESAQWFSQGYFGREWAELESRVFSTIPEDEVTISWITPMDTCANWAYSYGGDAVETWDSVYLPAITERLNSMLPGVNLTDADTHGALYACAYDYAALRISPWCDVFNHDELANFEYELDILMDGAFGYNLPGNMGPLLGTIFVKKLIERFSDSTGNASAVYLEFGHDTTIDTAFAALGLAKDTPPLSATGPVPPNRAFRTSTQVPFGAQMVWEKFTCTSSFNGPQIRLIMNDSPFSLSACAGTEQDRSYGSCSFNKFVDSNAFSTSVTWGDAIWNATCGEADL